MAELLKSCPWCGSLGASLYQGDYHQEVACPVCYQSIQAEDAIAAWNALPRSEERLRAALQKAVADYGKPGGPWNVPNEPGAWLQMAKDALGGK